MSGMGMSVASGVPRTVVPYPNEVLQFQAVVEVDDHGECGLLVDVDGTLLRYQVEIHRIYRLTACGGS
eukprot:2737989-Prorocentrum_lima.AAC.1